jgi:hypothetical protein
MAFFQRSDNVERPRPSERSQDREELLAKAEKSPGREELRPRRTMTEKRKDRE